MTILEPICYNLATEKGSAVAPQNSVGKVGKSGRKSNMLLRIQDRILLSLAFLGDLFEDLADAGGLMSASYKQIYGFIPKKYKKHNFVSAVNYALRTGKIEKIVKNNEVCFRLTGKGEKKLIKDLPLAWFQKKRWDGLWRMLSYDIKEIKRHQRNRLRIKLYDLGFRQFQKSVYISPYPIEKEMNDFLKTLNLEGKAYALLCNKILGVENKELARELWQLDKLNKKYEKLFRKLKSFTDKREFKKIKVKYLELLSDDPFFPKELLPRLWWAEKVKAELKKIKR